jgi:4-hydroxy-tetrahydrodipicolinate synthase
MQGVYTALATPFDENGEIDYRSLDRILGQQIQSGIRGFVVCGTTGESPTLSREEKKSLFRHVLEFSRGQYLDLVAGTGTNDTRESVALTTMAYDIGFRRFLAVVPYYNRPSQAGLLAHFSAIGDAVPEDGEVILYNVPGRSGVGLAVETIVALADHPRIRAIKEASGDLDFLAELKTGLARANRTLALLSGDDATYAQFLAAGGSGVISVASHICPRAMIEIEAALKKGDGETARRLHENYAPLFRDLFVESNPGPLNFGKSTSASSGSRGGTRRGKTRVGRRALPS